MSFIAIPLAFAFLLAAPVMPTHAADAPAESRPAAEADRRPAPPLTNEKPSRNKEIVALERAAASGSAEAAAELGSRYDHGVGGAPQDLAAALRWYRRGADGGDASAMGNLGYAYEFGRGIGVDLAAARHWYEKAIATDDAGGEGDQDDEGAIVNLADMYIRGFGVPADPAKGRALLERGVKAGFFAAMTQLAIVEMDKPKPDGALVMRLLRRAVVGNSTQAQLQLALALEAGLDSKPDHVEANVWFAKAAVSGNDLDADNRASAAFGLGQNLLHGRGIDMDLPAARDWLGKSAAGGTREAVPTYAYMLLAGLGGPAQPREALAVLQKLDDAAADMIRASALAHGAGGHAERAQALAILEARARASRGVVTLPNPWDCDGRLVARSAAYDLAALSAHPDPRLMRRAAAEGDARAILWLGEVEAKSGRDWTKANDLIWRAANTHLAAASFALGLLILADGDPHDIPVAVDDFVLALEARDPRAISALAAKPPRLPKHVIAALAQKIATDPDVQHRLGATTLPAALDAAQRAITAEPAVTRAFCAVVHP